MDEPRLSAVPGVNLDDKLRQIPGFSLLRRTSSLAAHPTTQGVSLRGLGPTGASRTLVLADGVPLNDPFGGWVYWTRVPPDEIARIEVSRGASTAVFGDRAMGGAISIFSREPESRRVWFAYEGGNRNTHEVSGGYANLFRRFALDAHARGFSTDGYYVVPEGVRGAVDRPVGASFASGAMRLDWFLAAGRVSFRSDFLAEERANGTLLQDNSTGLGQASLAWNRNSGGSNISLLAFHTREQFHSTFSAIAADRSTERLTYRQRVPAEGTGGSGIVTLRRGPRWNLTGGADALRVEGYSEDALSPSGIRLGGGVLKQGGGFFQSDVRMGPATLFLGGRQQFTGTRGFLAPSAGIAVGGGPLRARASVYRAMRAPTLNELYREFRAGNTITRANEALGPERLLGAEAGADWVAPGARVRLTAFRNSLRDIITNVTLTAEPNLIVRQRRNEAAALNRGFEFEAEGRRGPWRGELGYLFVDSRFATRERVPQVARHNGAAAATFTKDATLLSVSLRTYGSQFEDERNQFRLPGFLTLQLAARRRLSRGFSALVAVENILDRRYLAGFTPAPLVGAPRLWRAGLRWELR